MERLRIRMCKYLVASMHCKLFQRESKTSTLRPSTRTRSPLIGT
jgi:hypothetical protein